MGLLRLANPLCANVSPPRKRTARAAERLERMTREAFLEADRVRLAKDPVRQASRVEVEAACISAMLARGEHVPEADLELLARRIAEAS